MIQRADRKLSLRELAVIVGLLSLLTTGIASAVAWVHAEVTVPQILQETREQTAKMMDRHERATHQGSFTQREFQLWSEQVLKRLDSIERAVNR